MASDLIAVIPAAGRGTRLGTATPKVFTDITPALRVWDVLLDELVPVVDRVHLVLSEEGLAYFDALGRPTRNGVAVTVSVQTEPRGMGDAVFGAIAHWQDARHVLVVWGDQVGLSRDTMLRATNTQRNAPPPSVTLPLVATERPYVHYCFDPAGRLLRVDQTREGSSCPASGLADVGLFAFTAADIAPAWARYLSSENCRGARTGEINLLPFFAHLSVNEGFAVHTVTVADPGEARGINTPDDLAYFRARLDATR
jgi:bifunctional UDP-N-acetylglucosamine pyrophosphorylase/glucosamine-1-phosphate N-acetyltransferase